MATDRQLSANFMLHEFPGWERATEAEVQELAAFVDGFLQPLRNGVGRLVPSSWRWWNSGRERDGAHGDGAVDLVPLDATTREVATYARDHLSPRSFRQIIDERDHVHTVPPFVLVAGSTVNGEVLHEPVEGTYHRLLGNTDPLVVAGLVIVLGLALMLAGKL